MKIWPATRGLLAKAADAHSRSDGLRRDRLEGKMQRRCVQARGASRRSSLGSRPRPARAVAIRMAVLVTEKTMRHACESESAKTIIERGHERGTWAGMLKRIEQSEAHLAELLPTNGDDGSSGCGGEGHDGGDADGSSGVERRWPAAVGGGRRVKTRRGRRRR